MRAALCLLALAGTAAADPHKPAPDKFTAAAAKVFDKAVAAEQAQRWREAIELYQQAYELSPHPNAIFNVAALEAEHGEVEAALIAYQIYLELAPTASDRAEVDARMTELAARKRTYRLEVQRNLALEDAYVLVDGDIVAKPGQIRDGKLALTYGRGRHWVAVVTPISFGASSFGAVNGFDTDMRVIVQGQNRADGNLLVVLDFDYSGELDGKTLSNDHGVRLSVAPGPHWLKLRDRDHECTPVQLDLPPGEDVQFVLVAPTEWFDPQEVRRCRAMGPKLQRLRFKLK